VDCGKVKNGNCDWSSLGGVCTCSGGAEGDACTKNDAQNCTP
jgi:hypothetical protein